MGAILANQDIGLSNAVTQRAASDRTGVFNGESHRQVSLTPNAAMPAIAVLEKHRLTAQRQEHA